MALGTMKGMRPGKTIASLEDLAREAVALVSMLEPKTSRATLVTLSGELGAGKTAFSQAVARALGVTEYVTSPTFVLAKTYDLPEGNSFRRLVHIDAYRLTSGKELTALDFARVMEDSRTLVLLEWPEMVEEALPDTDIAITLELQPDESRTLTYA